MRSWACSRPGQVICDVNESLVLISRLVGLIRLPTSSISSSSYTSSAPSSYLSAPSVWRWPSPIPVPPGSSTGRPLVGCDGSISDHHYRSLRGDFEDSSLGIALESEHAIFGRCALCRLDFDSS